MKFADRVALDNYINYLLVKKNSSNKIVSGNILDIQEGVIIHQANNKRVMGAGLAKQIREKYVEHYYDYMGSIMDLGVLVKTRIRNKLGIIATISQDGYGRDKRYTDYAAVINCLNEISLLHKKNPSVQYYIPYGYACGLAGGDWNIVSRIIADICPFIIIVKYE